MHFLFETNYDMELIRGTYNIKSRHQGCVATIGNFDGIHLGHQKVIQQLLEKARQLNWPSLVITFEPLPQEYFRNSAAPARILRFREKLTLLEKLGVDRVLCLLFNAKLANLSAENFVSEILHHQLGIKWLIVGDDFHFGHNRQGDFPLLQKMGASLGFQVSGTDTLLYAGQRVGSSHVRTALAQGDLQLTAQLLGRHYSMCGRVIYGDQRGRQLGFPTANVALRRRVIPIQGVYAVLVHGLDAKPVPGVANVGNRPTVDGNRSLLEVYLLNFNKEIYGQRLEVEFLQKLRDEQKFASLDLLKAQILQDVIHAKKFFERSSLSSRE